MLGWLKTTLAGLRPKPVGAVLVAYGALLEKYPLAILDISTLPIPKRKMKALLKASYAKAANESQRHTFEAGFMFLSHFQQGVGAIPIHNNLLNGDTQAVIRVNMAILARWTSWNERSVAEREILSAEWKRFVEANRFNVKSQLS